MLRPEALEEWHRTEVVPAGEVSIEVLSGASAGGICAAIAAAQMQQERGPVSLLYECWVNRIDIRGLLQTRDLRKGAALESLLDSTIIADIAEFALAPRPPQTRPFVSPRLTLLLSLTKLRGVPYSLNGVAPESLEQKICYYADRMRFEMPLEPAGWDALRTAAMATGAFPLFLAPRALTRKADDYCPPLWGAETEPAVWPDWPFA